MNQTSMPKSLDFAIISLTLVAAIAAFLIARGTHHGGESGPLRVQVFVDGSMTYTYTVSSKDREYPVSTEYGYNILMIGPGGVRIIEADCSGQDCVRASAIHSAGGTIVCLPHKLLVRLVSDGDGVDAVAG